MSNTARRFLEMLAAQIPGRATSARTQTLRQYATRLAADMPPHMLAPEVADAIAKSLPDMPSYNEVLRAIRSSPIQPARPENGPRNGSGGAAGPWLAFCAAAGSDEQLLTRISVVRTHVEDAWPEVQQEYATFLRRHRPEWLPQPREDLTVEQRRAIVAAFRAKRLIQAAPPPHGPQAQQQKAPPPADKPMPLSDADMMERYERLARDGNPVAIARVQHLRERMGTEA